MSERLKSRNLLRLCICSYEHWHLILQSATQSPLNPLFERSDVLGFRIEDDVPARQEGRDPRKIERLETSRRTCILTVRPRPALMARRKAKNRAFVPRLVGGRSAGFTLLDCASAEPRAGGRGCEVIFTTTVRRWSITSEELSAEYREGAPCSSRTGERGAFRSKRFRESAGRSSQEVWIRSGWLHPQSKSNSKPN
jgi:hypothetical protein